jgi:hypothetical protein
MDKLARVVARVSAGVKLPTRANHLHAVDARAAEDGVRNSPYNLPEHRVMRVNFIHLAECGLMRT